MSIEQVDIKISESSQVMVWNKEIEFLINRLHAVILESIKGNTR